MTIKIPRFRLRTEILFNLVVIMVFSVLVIGIMILKFSRDFMIQRLEALHLNYALGIQRNFGTTKSGGNLAKESALLFQYLSDLETMDKGLSSSVYEVARDGLDKVFGENPSFRPGDEMISRIRKSLDSGRILPFLEYSRVLGFVKRLESIETFIPIPGPGSKKYVVCLTGGGIAEEANFRKMKFMVITYIIVFAFIVTTFGYFMLSKSVIKPLERISGAASSVASGSRKFSIKMDRQNEIGELAASIKKMNEKLLSNQRELVKNLEEVQKLNRALSEAQSEIVRVEKLASIGRLSSGVAHEIGNPLSAVLGYVEILRREQRSAEEGELLSRAESELQRISRIIGQLLDFARPARVESKKMNLNKFIEEVISDMKEMGIFEGVEVFFNPLTGTVDRVIDEGQLRQVLLNLLKNASDAIRARKKNEPPGRISVSLSISKVTELEELKRGFYFGSDRRKTDPPEKIFHVSRVKQRKGDPPDAGYFRRRIKGGFGFPKFLFNEKEELIKLTIEDNGSGIRKKEIHKIFDPFYTTKEPGSGTGLGLYMTLNTVEAMGGYIDVISEYGKGTLFLVLIPKHVDSHLS